jgi:hypothetical protein
MTRRGAMAFNAGLAGIVENVRIGKKFEICLGRLPSEFLVIDEDL